MTQNISALLRERAALRSLADQCVKARGELGTTDSPTALFIERMAFNIAERWAQVDAQARSLLANNAAFVVALNEPRNICAE